ncbi:MAG: universal stress protein UspA [Tepidiforma sp.]|uniref:universal stress protein n=1 Tax=Tepidiforma sp. TaxID=2682230 RepID=UPI0021DEE63C|nr:universal stress protein [Tepidiforma sp.]GIW16236.1 MAG: universal stress protein UspA [Tepidiforma sp.]
MAENGPILIPLDGSSLAEYALVDAAWLKQVTGLPVRLIHVMEHDGTPEERQHAAEKFREYATAQAEKHGLGEVTCDVVVGPPAKEILQAAETASYVVIATHGRGGFKAMVLGSVADKVIRGSKVPVLAEPGTEAPEPPGNGRPILVALDGSEDAEKGLALARELAAKAELPLVLLRAYSVPPPAGIEFSYYPADLSATLEAAAREYLQATAKPGERTVLVQGDAATAILEVAEQEKASLIVMTSTGKGLLKRLALGSTTDRVVHGTHRPVLVVPTHHD